MFFSPLHLWYLASHSSEVVGGSVTRVCMGVSVCVYVCVCVGMVVIWLCGFGKWSQAYSPSLYRLLPCPQILTPDPLIFFFCVCGDNLFSFLITSGVI